MIAGALRRTTATAASSLISASRSSRCSGATELTRSTFWKATSTNLSRFFAAKSDGPSLVAEVKPGVPGEVPSILDQATGLERAEIDHPDLFKHNEVIKGPFGTAENPVKIQSAYDSRIVGCTGKGAPDDHDLVWILVEKNQVSVCEECGQVFELDPL